MCGKAEGKMKVKTTTAEPLSHERLLARLDVNGIHPKSTVRVRLQGFIGDEILLPVKGVRIEFGDKGMPDYVEILT